MSHPFRCQTSMLRQRFLTAIGGGSLLAAGSLGCGFTSIDARDAGAMMNADPARPEQNPIGASGGGGRGGTGGSTSVVTAGSTSTLPMTPAGGTGGQPMVDAGRPIVPTCWNGMPPEQECITRAAMETKAQFGCGQIPTSPEPTPEQVAAAFLPSGCLPKEMACDGCCNPAEMEGIPQDDGSCCYVYCGGACCGRAFTVDGEARVAGLQLRTDWLDTEIEKTALRDDISDDLAPLRSRIAHEWLDDARMEHASIASFARFTLELLAFGAPGDLLEAAQRAALDEVAHARACFALAARYEGVARGPSPLHTADGVPAQSLHDAACRTFIEGCIGETIAAALARAACAESDDADVCKVLAKIADDEARHADLAWRFVAWALSVGGQALVPGLNDAIAHARAARSVLSMEQDDSKTRAALHRAGRLSAYERDAVISMVFAEVIEPCTAALLESAGAVLASPKNADVDSVDV